VHMHSLANALSLISLNSKKLINVISVTST